MARTDSTTQLPAIARGPCVPGTGLQAKIHAFIKGVRRALSEARRERLSVWRATAGSPDSFADPR